MLELSPSTVWLKGRFSHMAGLAAKTTELGFTHIELNSSVSPAMLNKLLKTTVLIPSIHSHCPAVLSSKGIPINSLSLSSRDDGERAEGVSFAEKMIDVAANGVLGLSSLSPATVN